jgi:hypothetical protein
MFLLHLFSLYNILIGVCNIEVRIEWHPNKLFLIHSLPSFYLFIFAKIIYLTSTTLNMPSAKLSTYLSQYDQFWRPPVITV